MKHTTSKAHRTAAVLAGFALAAFAALAVFTLAGCEATDAVAKYAPETFAAAVGAPGITAARSGDGTAWLFTSPKGDELSLSTDFSRNESADARYRFDAAPFLAAGLDPVKLAAGSSDTVRYRIEDGNLVITFELGNGTFSAAAAESPRALLTEIVKTGRDSIGYHEKLDHYGIKLGGGNMFEWARDVNDNDKDIVFVLDPVSITAAGADPAAIAGWAFAQVEMKDDAGKTVFANKLLKPFNLK